MCVGGGFEAGQQHCCQGNRAGQTKIKSQADKAGQNRVA